MGILRQYILFAFLLSLFLKSTVEAEDELAVFREIHETYNTADFSGPASNLRVQTPGSLRCGQPVDNTTTHIYYSPFEPVLDNERCVWIISDYNAMGYKVKILHLGDSTNQEDSGQGLIITGVRRGSPLKTYLPMTNGTFDIRNVNVLVITFFSSISAGESSTGFALRYIPIMQNGTPNFGTPLVISSPTFNLTYPLNNGITYRDNELTVFVFPPENNFFREKQNTNIRFYKRGLEECCDFLNVYSLDVNGTASQTGVWKAKGRITGRQTTARISHDDVTMLIFESDGNSPSSGFSFTVTS